MRHRPQPVSRIAAAKATQTVITHEEVSTCPSRLSRMVLATAKLENRQKNRRVEFKILKN